MSRILKGSLIVIIFSLLTAIINYILRLFYSRILSIEGYGLFYAGVGLINLFLGYVDLGYSYPVTYLIPKYIKAKNLNATWNVFRHGQIVQLSASLLISVIMVITAPLIASYYFKSPQEIVFIYFLASYLLVSSILSTLYYFYIGLQNEKYYSSLLFVRILLIVVISFVVWKFESVSVNNLVGVWTLSCLASVLGYAYLLRRKYALIAQHKFHWNKKLFGKMTSYAIPSILTVVVYSFITFGDIFLLTLLTNITKVAYYSIILPLATIPLMFISPLSNLFLPLISQLMEGEKERVRDLLLKSIQMVPVVALYFALFMFLFPKNVISLMFGAKWLGYIENWLGLLAFGFVLTSLSSILSTFLVGLGMVTKRLRLSIIIALFSVVMYFTLIKLFDVKGAVMANFCVAAISLFLYFKAVSKEIIVKIPKTFYLKLMTLITIAFIVRGVIKIPTISIYQFILLGVGYSITFTTLVLILKLVDIQYLKHFVHLMRNKGITDY